MKMADTQVTDEMADAAITWFARLRADDVTASDRAGFLNWLREHRDHQIAFVEILNLWEDLSVIKQLDFEELKPFPLLFKHVDGDGGIRRRA